jgi:inner membrane protein
MNFIIEPWHWFVLGILLILSELILPAFAALWFGVAAIVISLLVWLFPSIGLNAQIILWVVLSISCALIWFKFIKPLSTDKTKAGLSREATVGQVGMVIQIGHEPELVIVRFQFPVLGSDEWNCRTLSPVQIGERVRVTDILGNELVVQPHSNSNSPL